MRCTGMGGVACKPGLVIKAFLNEPDHCSLSHLLIKPLASTCLYTISPYATFKSAARQQLMGDQHSTGQFGASSTREVDVCVLGTQGCCVWACTRLAGSSSTRARGNRAVSVCWGCAYVPYVLQLPLGMSVRLHPSAWAETPIPWAGGQSWHPWTHIAEKSPGKPILAFTGWSIAHFYIHFKSKTKL